MLSLAQTGRHRDLHSFPTRRSSDLSPKEKYAHSIWPAAVDECRIDRRHPPLRSEEHTSELQSHHDLVCRLLLEKKKSTEEVYCSRCVHSGTLDSNTATTGYRESAPN